ncbi:MAG: heme-binding domain-containing protein [FCB group bacterium]|nr:heme-binding domain-containing protein [FCB group bacterium]
MKRKIIALIILVLVTIQFFRIDKSNPPSVPSQDFISMTAPSDEIATLLKTACYDCHSNQTRYPWYTNIAPVSWLIKNHINEAREYMNFSEWGTYPSEEQVQKLSKSMEEVDEGEMPLFTYTLLNGDAKLNAAQQAKLTAWFQQLGGVEDYPADDDE